MQYPYQTSPCYANIGGFYKQCNSYNQAPQPEIVGEGEITSICLSDGSIKYCFLPYLPQVNRNNVGLWQIRDTSCNQVNKPMSVPTWGRVTSMVTVPCQQSMFDAPQQPYDVFNPFGTLKWHNDNHTSTTDLHHFVPRMRRFALPPGESAALQVQLSPERTIYHYTVPCSHHCFCKKIPAENNQNQEVPAEVRNPSQQQHVFLKDCKRKDAASNTDSAMSIDDSRSDSETKHMGCKCSRHRKSNYKKTSCICNVKNNSSSSESKSSVPSHNRTQKHKTKWFQHIKKHSKKKNSKTDKKNRTNFSESRSSISTCNCKITKNKRNRNKDICICNSESNEIKPETASKVISTYADQCCGGANIDGQPEVWTPISHLSKQHWEVSEEQTTNCSNYENIKSNDSTCICHERRVFQK